jgi:hypothetical protein
MLLDAANLTRFNLGMARMKINKCPILFAFVLASAGTALADYPVPFPGPQPGDAKAAFTQNGASLENADISCHWSIDGNALKPLDAKDLLSNTKLQFTPNKSECFEIQLAGGKILKASDFHLAGGVTVQPLVANANAPRLAERFGGKELMADLVSPDQSLEVHWHADLRDGSHYIRQFITIENKAAPVMVDEVILPVLAVDGFPAAKTEGSAAGSPVVMGNVFIAAEFPSAANKSKVDGSTQIISGTISRTTKMRAGDQLSSGRPLEYSSVIGVVPDGQLRRGFLSYIERERAHPYRQYLHYNSWCDIRPNAEQGLDRIQAYEKELVEKRGVSMQGFLFDDGWDDTSKLWQLSEKQFPDGLKPLTDAAAKFGAHMGLWLSPWGGYATAAAERTKHARENYKFSQILNGFALADPGYFALVEKTCSDYMRNDGVNIFKYDGILAGESGEGEAIRRLCTDLRKINPDVYFNVSTGSWASPFFLMYSDAIWRGGGDGGWSGKGDKRQQWLNFRDGQTYANIVSKGPLFPINSLMLHGISCLTYGPWHEVTPELMKDEFRSYFSTGTSLRELYITPSVLTQENWDSLGEAAKWAQENNDVLVDTHWIGGDPAKAVYGWASWAPRKGIIVLRNPLDTPLDFSLDVGNALELPKGSPQHYSLKSPWKNQASEAAIELTAGQAQTISLKPFELRIWEAAPQQ